MSNIVDAYVGEIRMFAGLYAPEGWHFCNGNLMSISTYQILFSLIGTTYGGDGVNTFALPDLRGRVPIGQGQGTGLTARTIGQSGGGEAVTLTSATIPPHNHVFNTIAADATTGTLVNTSQNLDFARGVNGTKTYMANATANPTTVTLATSSVSNAVPSGQTSHNNMMPSFVVNFIICMDGIYPQRP